MSVFQDLTFIILAQLLAVLVLILRLITALRAVTFNLPALAYITKIMKAEVLHLALPHLPVILAFILIKLLILTLKRFASKANFQVLLMEKKFVFLLLKKKLTINQKQKINLMFLPVKQNRLFHALAVNAR